MAEEEVMSRTAVGHLPVLTDPWTWAPARAREKESPDVTESLAHVMFRGINPARPASPFAKQITAMPHARISSLGDSASSITVVRRRRGMGYRRLYLGFLDNLPADPPLVPTFEYILKSPPHIEEADLEGPTTAPLTTARNNRSWLAGHLVGWHQSE